MTRHKAEAHGKQVKVNNLHWGDMESEAKAKVTAKALENYFHQRC